MKKLLLILLCLPMIGFGQCISGDCKNGYGIFIDKANGDKYIGKWTNGKSDEYGLYLFSDGSTYLGYFKNGSMHGHGTYISEDNIFIGEWKENKMNGLGTLTYFDGSKDVGLWRDGKFIENTEILVGCTSGDCNHGHGTYTWPSGDKYVGEWKNGHAKGQGTYTGASGEKYVGEYRDSKMHGHGTYTWPAGDKYVGEYKVGEMHGQGTMMWHNGKKYVGQWKEGKKNGYGTEVEFESEYAGEWRDDQKWIPLSEVDENIPTNKKVENRFALVIGNEDYQSKQRGLSEEQNVDYAVNDATIFKQYCLNILGVKEENMFHLINATAGEMNQKINLITKFLNKLGGKAELIVYYAGHGYPDELTKVPYLIPVDVSASNLSSAIKLDDLYQQLAKTNASKITIFLDACFTGGGRNSGLLASRGVKVKPKQGTLNGNIVVFSASSKEQSSLPYKAHEHGIFTYFLLKKFQETKGNVTLGELSEYLEQNVSIKSLRVNQKEQDPTVNTSPKVANDWRNWKF